MAKKVTSDQLWNQTYVEDMSPHVESALNTTFERIAQKAPQYPTDCGVMCRRIHNHLSTLGVKSHVLSGQFTAGLDFDTSTIDPPLSREHVWLEVDGSVVDPTAIQYRDRFSGDFEPHHYKEETRYP